MKCCEVLGDPWLKLAYLSRDAAAGIYAELRGLKPTEFIATERTRRYICASIWFGTSLMLALVTDGIGIVIKYLGSVASANIFIYPGKNFFCSHFLFLKRGIWVLHPTLIVNLSLRWHYSHLK